MNMGTFFRIRCMPLDQAAPVCPTRRQAKSPQAPVKSVRLAPAGKKR